MPAILTLAHRDVIIVLFCVCLCVIRVISIFPPFLVCACICVSPSHYFSLCVRGLCISGYLSSSINTIIKELKERRDTPPLQSFARVSSAPLWCRYYHTLPSSLLLFHTSWGDTQGKTSPNRPFTPPRHTAC